MARRVVRAFVVTDKNDATEAVADMAGIDRELTLIELELKEKIDQAKAEAAQKAAGLRDRYKDLEKALCTWAKLRKEELFTDGKTLDLGCGKIGFRMSMPSIAQQSGVTVEASLARLRELGLAEGITVKESLAKAVLLGWPEERLALVGLRIKQTDDFFVDITKEAIPQGA